MENYTLMLLPAFPQESGLALDSFQPPKRRNNLMLRVAEIFLCWLACRLEISIVMGKFGMELNNERVWTSFFQEISITWTHKLGLTWIKKSVYINGSTLKTPRRKHITHCLLSGRSQVQLPPGTPIKCCLVVNSKTLHPLRCPPVTFTK